MAQRSTRNKVKFQAESAAADLNRAQTHFTQLAALADDNSDYINAHLPILMAGLDVVLGLIDSFREKL